MEQLKQKRIAQGYSYQKMANHLKISKTYYWQIENDKRRLSYQLALKIAAIFRLKPDDLFYDEHTRKDD